MFSYVKLSMLLLVCTAHLTQGFVATGATTANRALSPASSYRCASAVPGTAARVRISSSSTALTSPAAAESIATATSNAAATKQRLRLAALLAVKAPAVASAAAAGHTWLATFAERLTQEQRVLAGGVLATVCVGVLGGVSFGSALCAVTMLV